MNLCMENSAGVCEDIIALQPAERDCWFKPSRRMGQNASEKTRELACMSILSLPFPSRATSEPSEPPSETYTFLKVI